MPFFQGIFYFSEDTELEQEPQNLGKLCSSRNQLLQLHTSRKHLYKERMYNKAAKEILKILALIVTSLTSASAIESSRS